MLIWMVNSEKSTYNSLIINKTISRCTFSIEKYNAFIFNNISILNTLNRQGFFTQKIIKKLI